MTLEFYYGEKLEESWIIMIQVLDSWILRFLSEHDVMVFTLISP